MSFSDFVHFVNPEAGFRARAFDGYLSFLAAPPHPAGNEAMAYRCFADDGLYWLELKDEIHEDTLGVRLKPEEPCLWIVIALIGDYTVCSESVGAGTVASGNSICSASSSNELSIELNPGKNWLFVVGFGQRHFNALTAEFPFLASLIQPTEGDKRYGAGEERPISSRLRSLLESLRRMVFRPFSTPIQLAGWSLRLLNYFAQGGKVTEMNTADKDDISHYHQAVKFIREHYLDDIDLEQVADTLHISVRNLTRSFESRAYTVNGYISHLRLTKARELLAFSDRPIRDVAYTLRFSCPKHFSKMFRQKFKKSPKTYRDEMRKERLGLNKAAILR